MPQTVRFENFPQITTQLGSLLTPNTATVVEGDVACVHVGNGLWTCTFTTVSTGLRDFIVEDDDGNLLGRWQVTLTGSGTVDAKDRQEVRLTAAIDDIEGGGPSGDVTVNVNVPPFYAQLQNPVLETNFKLDLTEVKAVTVGVFGADGATVDLEAESYDTYQLVIKTETGTVVQTVEDADITISGSTFRFVNDATVTASPRTLPYKLWGNGPGAIHTKVVEGRISVE